MSAGCGGVSKSEKITSVPSYHEHQQLIAMTRELAELIDQRSWQLARLIPTNSAINEIPKDSPIHNTWSQLGMAFRLLSQHAQSLKEELARLGLQDDDTPPS